MFLPENLRRQTTKLRWSAPRKKNTTGKNACATAQPKPSLTCGNFRLVILSAQTFYLPPVPVLTAHKRGGFGRIRELQFRGVPLERGLGEAGGDRSQEHGLGQRPGVIERSGGLAIPHHRFDPL